MRPETFIFFLKCGYETTSCVTTLSSFDILNAESRRNVNMEIKDLLRINRENNKLTQEQLADKIYVSRQTVSKWERAESLPDLENIIILSDLYDISIDQLLRGAKFLI